MNPKQMMFARRRRAEKIGILGVHGRFWGKSGVRGRRGGGGGGVFPAPGAIRPLSAKSWRLKPYA